MLESIVTMNEEDWKNFKEKTLPKISEGIYGTFLEEKLYLYALLLNWELFLSKRNIISLYIERTNTLFNFKQRFSNQEYVDRFITAVFVFLLSSISIDINEDFPLKKLEENFHQTCYTIKNRRFNDETIKQLFTILGLYFSGLVITKLKKELNIRGNREDRIELYKTIVSYLLRNKDRIERLTQG